VGHPPGDAHAAGAAPPAGGVTAEAADLAAAAGQDSLLDAIAALKSEQKALRTQRRQVAKDLKNAERRRSRLKKRARLLSDQDLAQVISMRAAAGAASGGSPAKKQAAVAKPAEELRERSPPRDDDESDAAERES
jgi:hypothetical protein